MTAEKRRKLLYGVHGYERGHAARAQAVLPELAKRYDTLVLAGDDAYEQLRGDWPVVRIPTLRYYCGPNHRRSPGLTIRRNLPAALDLLLGGPVFQRVRSVMREFAPAVVVSDSEGWTHRAARSLGVPRVGFDHYGILVHCRLPLSRMDRLVSWCESLVYRALVCRPERVIVAAFYDGPPRRDGVRVVGPILREFVRKTPATDGEYLLVYFSNGRTHFTPAIERALSEMPCPVKMYGLNRAEVRGNIEFRPAADEPFVRDLAGCRAVFATAGNQLISEALHFGKPMLLMPEDALEQRLNAQFIQRWQIGLRTTPKQVTAELLRQFVARRDEFAANIPAHRRDGLAETLVALSECIDQLAAQGEQRMTEAET